MPNRLGGGRYHPHVQAVMDETGESNPFLAVSAKARALVGEYHGTFGETPPFNMHAFASYRGLYTSDDAPRHSQDSEIAPEADGRVVLRLNRDRPHTRQRFSIGHEIGHTLFPEYQLFVRCRKGTDHSRAHPDEFVETLCDVAASEFLFPRPWFQDGVCDLALSAQAIGTLATEYEASRDATTRRFVEIRTDPLAAVFFSWKLKPTEERQVQRDRRQQRLFSDPECFPNPEPKLRVDYAILNNISVL